MPKDTLVDLGVRVKPRMVSELSRVELQSLRGQVKSLFIIPEDGIVTVKPPYAEHVRSTKFRQYADYCFDGAVELKTRDAAV